MRTPPVLALALLLALPATALPDPHPLLDEALNGREGVTTERYPISGAKLADLPEKFEGGKDKDGRTLAGSAMPSLEPVGDTTTVTAAQPDQACRGARWTATTTAKVEWSLTWTIKLPTWTDRSSASAAAQAEWDRFVEAVRVHEEGHVTAGNKAFQDAKPQTTFTGSGSACTEAEARALAEADAKAKVDAEFARLEKAIEDAGEAYDEATNHGATQGATLNTRIP